MDVPSFEPDAIVESVPAESAIAEVGAWTYTRDIANAAARLLAQPVETMAVRCNPWHNRPCPKMVAYDMTIGGHHISVIWHETSRRSVDAYTVIVNGRQVPFEPSAHGRLAWQLARTVWIAVGDQRIANERSG